MKRRVIKISLAILVVVGILLGLLAVLTRDWGPEVPFDFLAGRALTARIERNQIIQWSGHTRTVYSFEGDFADYNDVCTKADSELLAMGFTLLPPMGDTLHTRFYLSSNVALDPCVCVGLSYRREAEAPSTLKSPEHSIPNRRTSQHKSGSISVSVVGTPRRSWWPRRLLRRLQAMLRRTANNPPARKS